MIGIAPTPEVRVQAADGINTLRVLNAKAAALGPPLIKIKNLMVDDHVRNFESGGALFGGWPPREAEFGLSFAPMVKSGTIRDQLRARGKQGSGGATYIESRKGIARAGTGAKTPDGKPYPRFHQAGATRPGRGGVLPKRELVGITDATRTRSVEIIRQYLTS